MFSPSVVFDNILSVKNIYTAFVVRREKDFDFKGESHDFWELVYINGGTVGITSGSRALECKAGTAVLHKPGEFHRIWSVGSTEPVYTVVTFDAEGELVIQLKNVVVSLKSEGMDKMAQISGLISSLDIGSSIFPRKLQSEPILAAKLQKLLETVLILCIEEKGNIAVKSASPDAELFSQAVGIMKENISAPLSSDEIAAKMHISLSKLKRVFKKYALIGVHEYYFVLRMNKAVKMLGTGVSVGQCALECGFLNQNYFSAAFKRHFGVSPSEYK